MAVKSKLILYIHERICKSVFCQKDLATKFKNKKNLCIETKKKLKLHIESVDKLLEVK
jgi:hypothetical protein